MASKELSESLYSYAIEVMKNSNPYTTKETVLQKVVKKCAEILEFDLNSLITKNTIYIHPDNMNKIDLKWHSFMEQGMKLSHEELNTYKIIKSSDYVNLFDIQKLINIFVSKNENAFLAEILAVDNFDSADFKNYILNLKYGDKGDSHVYIIKEIYQKFNAPVPVVYFALLQIYKKFTHDKEILDIVTNEINKLENSIDKYLAQDIANMYENSIGQLQEIALCKLLQLKNNFKKIKIHKRNLRTGNIPNKKIKKKS